MAAAHGKALVHRDFKPDNVLVGADGRVRVADFGLVRIGAGDSDELTASMALPSNPTLTQTGAFMGTLGYMAPEQLDGSRVDHRSDQFAFGVSRTRVRALATAAHDRFAGLGQGYEAKRDDAAAWLEAHP